MNPNRRQAGPVHVVAVHVVADFLPSVIGK